MEARKKPEVFSRKQTRKKRQEEREMIRKGRAEKLRKQQEKERLRSFGHVDDSSDEDDDETLGGVSRLDRDLEEARARGRERGGSSARGASRRRSGSFRVLKNAASEAPASTPLLEGALVGLGAHTHLVSVDFTGDLMECSTPREGGRAARGGPEGAVPPRDVRHPLGARRGAAGGPRRIPPPDVPDALQARPLERREDEKPADLDERKSTASSSAVSSSGGYLRVRALQRFLGGRARWTSPARRRSRRLATWRSASRPGGDRRRARGALARYPRRGACWRTSAWGRAFDQGASDPETAGGLSATLWELTSRRALPPGGARGGAGVGAMPLVSRSRRVTRTNPRSSRAAQHRGGELQARHRCRRRRRSTKGSPGPTRRGGRAEGVLKLA